MVVTFLRCWRPLRPTTRLQQIRQGCAGGGRPWVLAEVKQQDEAIGGSLKCYQEQTKAPFAFQVVIDADYVDADCFARPRGPMVVPARTFLSQLL